MICWVKSTNSFLISKEIKVTLTPGMYFEKRSYSLLIWNANSLVWHITNTDTWPSTGSSCWRVAKTNTAVLPIPDLAWHKMSILSTAWGIHSCCTSEGCSNPLSTMDLRSSGFNKKSRKPELWIETYAPLTSFLVVPLVPLASPPVSAWSSSS